MTRTLGDLGTLKWEIAIMRRTYIIAEAGVNHNGSFEIAKKLVRAAADAGADAVKFQSFVAGELVSEKAPKAKYQRETTAKSETQFQMLKKLELSQINQLRLDKFCGRSGISFLSTAFDIDSARFLIDLAGLKTIKISSGDLTNAPLLFEIAKKQRSIILSTGMANIIEIESALGVIAFGYLFPGKKPSRANIGRAYKIAQKSGILKKRVCLMQCTTEYPAPYDEVNLRTIAMLREKFKLPVGLSDHTMGWEVAVAAVAMGARLIEKHFTLNRNFKGPDHKASLTPSELKQMVQGIRRVEMALGSMVKEATKSEKKNLLVVRKSLVVREKVERGEKFTSSNLTTKRPGIGMEPLYYWDLLGKRAKRPYEKDEVIKKL